MLASLANYQAKLATWATTNGGIGNTYGMRDVADKVAWAIDQRGTTQVAVNAAVGAAMHKINKVVNRKAPKLTLKDGFAIARALGVPLEWLADDEQTGPPPPAPVSREEEMVLAVVRAIGVKEALIRLSQPAARTGDVIGTGEGKGGAKGEYGREDLTRHDPKKFGRQ